MIFLPIIIFFILLCIRVPVAFSIAIGALSFFIIDGGISKSKYFGNNNNENDALLDPDEIAKTYLNFYKQNKSAWSWEIEIRPWVEKF